MKLPFLNRTDELRRLKRIIRANEPALAVIYGRRRCGKSRLLQELGGKHTIYYLADQSAEPLQIASLARQVSSHFPGFDAGLYPSWASLFEALNARSGNKQLTLVLDEFPYLVAESPALPSILQKMIDAPSLRFSIIIAGSSQRMMKQAAFGESAPLFGRTREVFNVRPLEAGWITDAFKVKGAEAVTRYAVWGGVPRYWELAAEFNDHEQAMLELVLNRNGILHHEPRRLLLDDLRTDTQPHSLLAIIGSGVHRISEIGARLGKPAMNLLRSMEILMELGLVKRDTPFGEDEKNSKRTLYTIADPFLRFWYRYVFPNMSVLEQEVYDGVLAEWRATKDQLTGMIWEDLARQSTPRLDVGGKHWDAAKRWWGKNESGVLGEIDIVARSLDGSAILLGEAKWGDANEEAICAKLRDFAGTLAFTRGKQVITACWTGREPARKKSSDFVITPRMALDTLR